MTQEERALQRICKKLAENDKFYIKIWYRNSRMFRELSDPIAEKELKIGEDVYFCRREAFFDTFGGEVGYGYTVYKWDGTYTEQPLSPISDKTFKFKNWVEIFHSHGVKKVEPKAMIINTLKILESTKENVESEKDS